MFYHNINPVLVKLGDFEIRYYGLFYAISFIIAYFLIFHLAKQRKLDISRDDVSDLVVYLIAGIILGARIVYIIFYNFGFYLSNPLEIFAVWHGGLSFHGGMIGAVVSALLFCRKKKLGFYDIADIVVFPVAIGLAIGRIGNFMNGELYGRLTNSGLCIDYSKNKFLDSIPEGCRHPSQIYESAKNILIFASLWFLKNKNLPKGFLFWSFITLYGALRTIAEIFRQPDAQLGFIFGGFTMGQLLSIPLFIIGAYMLIRLKKKEKKILA